MTHPASAVKREGHQLVDLQIQTLLQPSFLFASALLDDRVRSAKIVMLHQELDRMLRASFNRHLRRTSWTSPCGLDS
jgi:hypothetical protein